MKKQCRGARGRFVKCGTKGAKVAKKPAKKSKRAAAAKRKRSLLQYAKSAKSAHTSRRARKGRPSAANILKRARERRRPTYESIPIRRAVIFHEAPSYFAEPERTRLAAKRGRTRRRGRCC